MICAARGYEYAASILLGVVSFLRVFAQPHPHEVSQRWTFVNPSKSVSGVFISIGKDFWKWGTRQVYQKCVRDAFLLGAKSLFLHPCGTSQKWGISENVLKSSSVSDFWWKVITLGASRSFSVSNAIFPVLAFKKGCSCWACADVPNGLFWHELIIK